MNKILTTLAVALLIGVAACSNEEVMNPSNSGDGNVSFSVTIPAKSFSTRAFGNGLSANKLEYAVYDKDANNSFVTKGETKFSESTEGSLSTTVNINLANGRDYNIIFFASPENSEVYTLNTENGEVTVDYSKMTAYNSSDYDCFSTLYNTGKVTGPINSDVTLYRPVAQVNWGTSDLNDETVSGTNGTYGSNAANLYTAVSVKGVNNVLNILTGARSNATGFDGNVAFGNAARPTGETFPVEPTTYNYLSMQYLLVPAESSVVDLELTAYSGESSTDAQSTVTVTNAPVQANYRTNIYGALLTNPANLNINKDPNFNDPDNNVKVVRTAAALAEALEEGGEIEVPADVELDLRNVNNGAEIELANNTVLTIKGSVNTARAQLVVKESTVTVDGEGVGKITSVGFPEGNRPLTVEKDATLIVKNISVETEQNDAGSAIYSEGNLELDNVTIECHNFAVYSEGGTLKANKSTFNSDSNNKIGNWSYTVSVRGGCEAVLDDCEVNGIQGGVSVGNENSIVTINGGTYTTRSLEGATGQTAFYPVYIFDKGIAVINSGDFISGCEYTIFNGNNDVPELYTWGNGACLKGGRYNKGTIDQENKLAYPAAEGYKWEAIEGDSTFKWKVVKE